MLFAKLYYLRGFAKLKKACKGTSFKLQLASGKAIMVSGNTVYIAVKQCVRQGNPEIINLILGKHCSNPIQDLIQSLENSAKVS